MSWKATTLSQIATNIQTGPFGSQLHQSDYSDSGFPVVMPKDLVNGHISESSIARVEKKHVDRLIRHIIEIGDILYSRRGDVGRCAYATNKEAGWLCGTGCLRVTIDPAKADSKFVFYQLQKAETVDWVEKHAVGSTMLNLNTTILGNIPIELPELNEQKRIVSMLSSFDELVENNDNQIKLLEEAAQRLYKEWFTGTDVCDLDNTNLSEIVSFKRGKTITKAQTIEGNVPVVAGGLEPAYYHNEANTTAPVITVSGSGANAGFARMYFEDVFASDCSFADSRTTPYLYFVYCFLKENKSQLDALQKGSAQPHVYAKDINAMVMKSFPEQKLEQFCGIVKPYFELIGNLEKQIKYAMEARDRLLPKLMSGEMEI